ncbi:TIR domain-containing protein [uncultured Aquimarina sp.]|uniref:TIR domain-containing protein n=1 Tax=uncultured Aquimarina sp. TaxID=575652 RepID=UPI00261260E1|nr:TIR domain-containing protein [uncultured Aquimarina sp.]
MGRKCFISFKTEDADYKEVIQNDLDIDMIDKSLNEAIDSDDEEYIMRQIREDYLSDSTVTIHLIGKHSAEERGKQEQKFIKRELQASLYNGENNTKNGILGVVLPNMYDNIYLGTSSCTSCGNLHNTIKVDNTTTIREFNYNYYIPNNRCSHSYEDRYCVLVKWKDFYIAPEEYIEQAFNKREAPISNKTKVYPN